MTEKVNPWLGLRSYEEGEYIYGRDKEAKELAFNIINGFLTIVYGKSGIGKSSILKAGVFPQLRNEDFYPIYIRLNHDSKESYYCQIEKLITEKQENKVAKIITTS